VANFGDGTVSKIQANDGTVLGTFNVGGAPMGVTFDGANIWVSDNATNRVMKLRATDGAILRYVYCRQQSERSLLDDL
jgi:DNA-binding beta-propeller fold protein YncE